MKKSSLYALLLFFALFFLSEKFYATHNRSGEITYVWLGGYSYKIRITTYTNNGSGSLAADRCSHMLYINDPNGNPLDSVECIRINGPLGTCNTQLPGARDGVDITPANSPNGGYRQNIYEANYTFSGPGTHVLSMFDPNRNSGSNNIPNSVNQPFALADTLRIFNLPGLTANNSPVLLNPPIDEACSGQIFVHNPNAYDPDGDSLSYSLTTCLGTGGAPIGGYIAASALGVAINASSGDMVWTVPVNLGEYNFAILITEWRKDIDGNYLKVGTVLRDLQVDVKPCTNQPPQITALNDTCILAGTNFTQLVVANDPNNNLISLSANGGPFTLNPAATFLSSITPGTASGTISWIPSCSAVRLQPYLITIKARDTLTGSVDLVDYESFYIKVIAPPPQNFTVNALGASMLLNWQTPVNCNQTNGNIIVAYKVYRKGTCEQWTPATCETGVPAYLGFTQIGQINAIGSPGPNYSYTDNNNGNGLSQGVDYSYIVVALFADGSQSFASEIKCVRIIRDIPLITNVSVDSTSNTSGKIFVRWVLPKIKSATEEGLDTVVNAGPYEFKLLQSTAGSSYVQIASFTKPYFANFNSINDTTFLSQALNTEQFQYNYKLEFFSSGNLIGTTQPASSVYLNANGLARRVQLNWTQAVPWTNEKYFIYKKNGAIFSLIDSTVSLNYTDTGLVNGQTYCYKIVSKGAYGDPDILRPLYNSSQEVCAIPQDKEAPCPPLLTVSGNCDDQSTIISWNAQTNGCANDAVYYNLYYKPNIDSAFIKIDSFPLIINSFYIDFSPSIAGCYFVTAIDSFGNESEITTDYCIDNCPEYELPNIITLNGDSVNDFFIPVKNKFVRKIELKIYNRWGTLLFETDKPEIKWNGKTSQADLPISDGTYFYVCNVVFIRFAGDEEKLLKGFFQVINK